nr:putative phage tail protein [Rhodoplanes tepidamans]
MLTLLPRGAAWPAGTTGAAGTGGAGSSLLAAVLRPLAEGIAEVEAAAEALMREVDPRSATVMLPDFERLLGADPCGRNIAALPLDERRRLAHSRYTARGGASRLYFEGVAEKRGTPIVITNLVVSQAGLLEAGDEIVGISEAFTFSVQLPLGLWKVAEAGELAAGDLIYSFEPSDLECEIGRLKPAHTEAVFTYAESGT